MAFDIERNDLSSLEEKKESLYSPKAPTQERASFHAPEEHTLPHAWQAARAALRPRLAGPRHVQVAGYFFGAALLFFVASLGIAGYFFYFGSNTVSPDKITIGIQGPTTIAGGDTVPLSLTITNTNPTALQNAAIEVDFPSGTRSATDVTRAYPRYVENLGTIPSGATITRSVKAIVFGGAGQTITLPVSLSYGTANSNAIFVKKSSYALAVSSTPLSVSIDTLTETISGAPLTFTLTVRSNATAPLDNVVLAATLPFGFQVTKSSLPLTNSTFTIGTLAPGDTKEVTLTGILTGQQSEQRVFHFTVGTATSAQDQTLAVAYMKQDATLTIAAPFITTSLAINGNTSDTVSITPGRQTISLSYANTLATTVNNAIVKVAISGAAVDYTSIKTTNGFYDSATHSIVFSKDTDPALSALAPGASGLGSFTFSTVPPGAPMPAIMFSITVSGTRVGQTSVPEQVTASSVKTAKVATLVEFAASSSHSFGLLGTSGPIPPRANQTTTYAIIWSAKDMGSPVAGATVTATLPSYVTYTGQTAGAGSFSYDPTARTVTWTAGDLAQGGSAQGAFEVSLLPSTSQKGSAPNLTSAASFSGYDRFAGVQITSSAAPVTTDITGGTTGATSASALVQ